MVLWGTLSGSMLPLLIRRLGFDPARAIPLALGRPRQDGRQLGLAGAGWPDQQQVAAGGKGSAALLDDARRRSEVAQVPADPGRGELQGVDGQEHIVGLAFRGGLDQGRFEPWQQGCDLMGVAVEDLLAQRSDLVGTVLPLGETHGQQPVAANRYLGVGLPAHMEQDPERFRAAAVEGALFARQGQQLQHARGGVVEGFEERIAAGIGQPGSAGLGQLEVVRFLYNEAQVAHEVDVALAGCWTRDAPAVLKQAIQAIAVQGLFFYRGENMLQGRRVRSHAPRKVA